jgi:hypothetical protein
MDRAPRFNHTHRRLSSNEGTVPMAVAATLAHPAGALTTPTSKPRTVKLVAVEIAETAA